jgi:hypothetical protein
MQDMRLVFNLMDSTDNRFLSDPARSVIQNHLRLQKDETSGGCGTLHNEEHCMLWKLPSFVEMLG